MKYRGVIFDLDGVIEDAHAGIEAAIAGGFDCAAIGDARDDERAGWHLSRSGVRLSYAPQKNLQTNVFKVFLCPKALKNSM